MNGGGCTVHVKVQGDPTPIIDDVIELQLRARAINLRGTAEGQEALRDLERHHAKKRAVLAEQYAAGFGRWSLRGWAARRQVKVAWQEAGGR